MLKIKDNVDLKELEKYGFKKSNIYYYEKNFTTNFTMSDNKHQILVYPFNRGIALDIINNDYTYHSFDEELGRIEETLYDLIKDGLVEKV